MKEFEYTYNTFFVPGTKGKPGSREFFIQMGDETEYICIKLEKFQVIALAESINNLLEDMPAQTESQEIPEEKPLLNYTLYVDEITVGVDLSNQVIVVNLSQHSDPETNYEDTELETKATVHINQLQAKYFIEITKRLLTQSRKPCLLCGQLEDSNHHCPRLN